MSRFSGGLIGVQLKVKNIHFYTYLILFECSANISSMFPFQNNPIAPSSKLHSREKVRLEKYETETIRPDICENTEDTTTVFNKSGFLEIFDPELIQTAMEVLNTGTKEELIAKDFQNITAKGEEANISSLMLELEILASEIVSGLDDENIEIEDEEEELFKT